MSEKVRFDRRDFMRGAAGVAFAGAAWGLVGAKAEGTVWQLDPAKCTQCGRCSTHCVLNPSAVKMVNQFNICGYCDLCFGYLQPGSRSRDTGAENQLCPTAAIKRTYIEAPYYEYLVDQDSCIGCAKCVEACLIFGNGSFYLQINQEICINCNECSIAKACPSDCFSEIPNSEAYMYITGDHDSTIPAYDLLKENEGNEKQSENVLAPSA